MNHYPHHIGDFDRATRHLTRIERSVYRDLIELYYDTESRLTLDKHALCRKILARSNEESTAVEQVLNEFFSETPDGWYHDRCEAEIEKYRANNSQKAQAGRASALKKEAKRQQALNARSTPVEVPFNETPTNQEPRTKNQEPGNSKSNALATRLPDDWQPSDADIEFCKTTRPDLNHAAIADAFRDYWIAVAGAKGRKLDWPATWRNWVRNQKAQPGANGYESAKDKSRRETYEQLTGKKSGSDAGAIDITAYSVIVG